MRPSLPWHVVVPVKEAALAKTRLEPPAPLTRAALARAMARDTLEAVCATVPPRQVVVVTSDAAARASASELGAAVVADPGGGLNAAVRAGLQLVSSRGGGPTAVLLGDVPAARPGDVARALGEAADHPRSVLPDRSGEGTVLLAALEADDVEPSFGRGSAGRHARGAAVLGLRLPRLRTDVDDAAALEEVVRLGVGRHTAAVLARAWGR